MAFSYSEGTLSRGQPLPAYRIGVWTDQAGTGGPAHGFRDARTLVPSRAVEWIKFLLHTPDDVLTHAITLPPVVAPAAAGSPPGLRLPLDRPPAWRQAFQLLTSTWAVTFSTVQTIAKYLPPDLRPLAPVVLFVIAFMLLQALCFHTLSGIRFR